MAVARPLFLYGTLRHLPLLEIVMGQSVDLQTARLDGFSVRRVEGADFPCIVADDAMAEGVLVPHGDGRARIDWYEGGYGYGTRVVTVETSAGPVEADLYWPSEYIVPSSEYFDLDRWVDHWGRMTCYAATEAMEGFGKISAATLAQRFPQIRGRAWSRVLSELEPRVDQLPGRPTGRAEVKTFRRPYTNYFSVLEHDLTFPRFDGTQSALVNRAAFISVDAVVVLPYDPVRDRLLLVEQFRPAMFLRGDPDVFSVEAVAGRVDAGEAPDVTARRETMEEAGLNLRDLIKVTTNYPSTGALTEYLTCYVGIADIADDATGIGGLLSEDENIRSHVFEWSMFLDWLDRDQFRNTPLILLGHWLARHRDRLRKEYRADG